MRSAQHDCVNDCGREGNTPMVLSSGRSGLICKWCLVTSEGGMRDQQFRAGRDRTTYRIPHTTNWHDE